MIAAARGPADLRRLAGAAAVELHGAPAEEILRWAAGEFGAGFAVAASMQDTALVHLASTIQPGVEVLFLDTGYHFVETLGTADAVEAVYPVTLRRLLPWKTVAQQDRDYGPRLHDRDPDLCCALRKVAPLDAALDGYEAWATGVRRVESPTRAGTPVVSFDEKRQRVRVAPLAAWTDEELNAYISRHHVLVNPLLSSEFPSIGCAPCTRAVAPGADSRSGRWAGLAKTECGINT